MTAQRQHADAGYRKVFDQRKRRVRGLWERNGAYYAQITIPDETTGLKKVRRLRLEDKDGNPVPTVPEAIKVMARLVVKREDGKLKLDPKRTPLLGEYADTYIKRLLDLGDAKRPATVRRERLALNLIKAHLGELRLRQITAPVINDYRAARKAKNVSGRAINIEVQVLRNVLKSALADGYINTVPKVERFKEVKVKRRLLTHGELEAVCASAVALAPMTGQMVSDFIKTMAYSGGRWGETLRLRWKDIDFANAQLHYGADGLSKNGEARAVDFNAKLEAHLRDMHGRRDPASEFLFPSPRRQDGGGDLHAITFNKTLRAARTAAKVTDFTCHLCRHYFVSTCVMAGIDYMTIARWVGHKDGGILVGQVYGHLAPGHAKAQAQRLNFEPVVIDGGKAVAE